jgi:fibronectin type 3 domain-containing protein
VPNPPQNFTAQAVSSTQVNLAWSGVTGATSYVVYQYINSTWQPIASTTNTTYAVGNLNPGTKYYFDVAARNAVGTSVGAPYQSATTFSVIQTPGSTTLSVKATSPSSVTLTWTASADATGYSLQEQIGGTWNQIANLGSGTLSFSVTGLGAASTTSFRVAGVNSGGPGAYSTASVLTTPAAPTNVVPTVVSNSQINVSWNAVGGATGYWVYYKTPTGAWTLYTSVLAGQTSVAVNSLTAGVTYTFEIAAFNNAGYTFSNPISATALVSLPPAPTKFAISALSTTEAQLSWNASAGATSYQIYWYTSTGWQKLTTTNTYIDLTLTHGQPYYFYVAAINAAGTGQGTASQTITV